MLYFGSPIFLYGLFLLPIVASASGCSPKSSTVMSEISPQQSTTPDLSQTLVEGMSVDDAFRALQAEKTVPFGSPNFYLYACTSPSSPGWTIYLKFSFTENSPKERVLRHWQIIRNVERKKDC